MTAGAPAALRTSRPSNKLVGGNWNIWPSA